MRIYSCASCNRYSVYSCKFVQCTCTHVHDIVHVCSTEFAEGGFSDDEGYTQSDDGTCAMVGSNMTKNVLVMLSFMLSVLVGGKWTFNAVLWKHGVIQDTK